MSILIKGMEMPHDKNLAFVITPKGDVYMMGNTPEEHGHLATAKAVPVPPHGRLIDADELMKRYGTMSFSTVIVDAPTIIPASEEGEK